MNPLTPLSAADATALAAIAGLSFVEKWSEKEFLYFLTHEHRLAMGIRGDDGRLLAYFVGLLVQGDLDVISVATLPEFRRKGLGRRLVEAALADLRVQRAFLEVRVSNTEAKRVYESVGFQVMGIRKKYYGGVEDAVQYRWRRGGNSSGG